MEKIEEFLIVDKGYGYGYGYGDGYGYGYGYGYGSGDGYGDGYGYGYGYGSGSGDGYGDGYGYGSGSGLTSLNYRKIFYIDGIAMFMAKVCDNMAYGYIVHDDLTTEKCFVAKSGGLFAHGRTAREASKALESKIFATLDTDETIESFLRIFKKGKKYSGQVFFTWHNYLTGSCEMGRKIFVKENNIDLDKNYTVEEFIEKTKKSFGGDIILQLEQEWNKLGG